MKSKFLVLLAGVATLSVCPVSAVETAGVAQVAGKPGLKNETVALKTVKLGEDVIEVEKVYAKYYIGLELGSEKRHEIYGDHEAERTIDKTVYGHPGVDWFVKIENHLVMPVCDDCEGYDEVKAKLELYSAGGVLKLEKIFDKARIIRLNVIKNGIFLAEIEPNDDENQMAPKRQEIYNSDGKLLYTSTGIVNFLPSPQGSYILFIEKYEGSGVKIGKVDLNGTAEILTKLQEDLYDICISDDEMRFILAIEGKTEKIALSGLKYWQKQIYFFTGSNLSWSKKLEAEGFFDTYLSKTAKYVILFYHADVTCKDMVSDDGEKFKACDNGVGKFMVLDTTTQKVVYDDKKDEPLISAYKNETVPQ